MGATRGMYPELLGDLDALPDWVVERALEEIASGTSCFGPLDEWVEWYHYLLPRTITRKWRCEFVQSASVLFTAFFAQHPDKFGSPLYKRFLSDSIITLGRYIMSPNFWPNGKLDVSRCLGKWQGPSGVAGWHNVSDLLSASLFFNIKYLAEDQLSDWFWSAISIPDRYWRMQIATWLVGSHAILTNQISQPNEFPERSTFGVGWNWSHVLRRSELDSAGGQARDTAFLPENNCTAVVEIARDWQLEEFFEDLMSDPSAEIVAWEVANLPEEFERLYQ